MQGQFILTLTCFVKLSNLMLLDTQQNGIINIVQMMTSSIIAL